MWRCRRPQAHARPTSQMTSLLPARSLELSQDGLHARLRGLRVLAGDEVTVGACLRVPIIAFLVLGTELRARDSMGRALSVRARGQRKARAGMGAAESTSPQGAEGRCAPP